MKNLDISSKKPLDQARGCLKPATHRGFAVTAGIAFFLATGGVAIAQDSGSAAPAEDPVVSAEVARLQDLNLILRQSKLGEDILILDREVARAEALKALITEIGPDGFRAAYPELAAALEGSPIMLRAEKEVAELAAELAAVTAPAAEPAPQASAAVPRSDGSDLLRGGKPEQGVGDVANDLTDQTAAVAALMEELAKSSAAVTQDAPLMGGGEPPSLREIHGLSGEYEAVVSQGSERIQVIKGDSLPGGFVVEAIGENWIDLRRGEETVRLNIRG